jgi:Ni/Co efflux regulator RcnB
MKRIFPGRGCTLAFVIAGIVAIGPAAADKPSWAGGDKGRSERSDDRDERDSNKSRARDDDHRSSQDRGRNDDQRSSRHNDRPSVQVREHFGDRHRTVYRDYYSEQFARGRCPPGLARKDNGCMPPGQARKWAVGRPLPRDVIFYEVPQPLVVQFGPPPSGHRYVRVAGDILLIALGTGMVIDALQDLGRM